MLWYSFFIYLSFVLLELSLAERKLLKLLDFYPYVAAAYYIVLNYTKFLYVWPISKISIKYTFKNSLLLTSAVR